jgi:hypothetical protein
MRIKYVALLSLLACLFTTQTLLADIGPKPTIEISFTDANIQLSSGELLQCKEANCSDAKPLTAVGPQRFSCNAKSCHGLAYGFSPYMQLRVTLANGKALTSSVFQKKAFNAHYTAAVSGDLLTITEK